MRKRRYILLFAGAIIWMVLVWIPFYERTSIALFLTALYCTVAACMTCVFIAVEIGANRRKVEERKTIERHKKIERALQRAQTEAKSKQEIQSYIEANRKWKLEKAGKLVTSGLINEATRMYDALELHQKAEECKKMAKPPLKS